MTTQSMWCEKHKMKKIIVTENCIVCPKCSRESVIGF